MRRVKVCAGIGDNIWLLMKLINAEEKFDFELPDGKPQRGKQIFDLLPQVASSASYVPGLSYKKLASHNIQNTVPLWRNVTLKNFYLSCNEHLELGRRIEDFFPDLETSFRINWYTEVHSWNRFNVRFREDTTYIGIYGSSYSTSRSWGFWNEHKWMDLIRLIHEREPMHVFVIIGAEWDLDLGRNLIKRLESENIPYVNTIGENLGYVIEVMKRLKYFFSFPSGLGILAPTVGCPVTMFYPRHLLPMMNAWASPDDIATGLYKGCQFCEPEEIFEWVIQNQKI